jgi:hypothetical protein
MVRELGVAVGQGFLLARPMPQPTLLSVDLAALESGGMIMSRNLPFGEPQLSTPPLSPM